MEAWRMAQSIAVRSKMVLVLIWENMLYCADGLESSDAEIDLAKGYYLAIRYEES
jgi:hypothetical protein